METYSRDKITMCTHTRKFSNLEYFSVMHPFVCADTFKLRQQELCRKCNVSVKVPSGLEACSLPSPGAGVLLHLSNIGMCR